MLTRTIATLSLALFTACLAAEESEELVSSDVEDIESKLTIDPSCLPPTDIVAQLNAECDLLDVYFTPNPNGSRTYAQVNYYNPPPIYTKTSTAVPGGHILMSPSELPAYLTMHTRCGDAVTGTFSPDTPPIDLICGGGGGGECITPPANMRAWYPMDSASGSTVDDIAGSNDGVRVGPVSTTGQVAAAYDFDGSNDYVYANDSSTLDFGYGDFSIDAWIKTTDSNATIVSKRQVVSGKYVGYLFMVNGGKLLLQIGDTTNSWSNYHSSSMPSVNDGQWHLVAVTVDRSSTTGGRMYIDGNLVYTFNPTNRSGNTSNSARLEIGRTTGGGNYFDGAIDEVELFNRALSASEIASLWNAGDAGKCKLICVPQSCQPGQCGIVPDGCGDTIFCGICSTCGDGLCSPDETFTCPLDCDCILAGAPQPEGRDGDSNLIPQCP